jgi:hypothetical protein
MKRKLVFCLLVAVCLHISASSTRAQEKSNPVPLPIEHGGKIESKYDGFSYETVILLKKMGITCTDVTGERKRFKNLCVSVAASLHCPGKQLDFVRYVKLQLVFEANDWDARHPLGKRDLTVVADGRTMRLGTMQLVNVGVGNGWLDERMREVFEVSINHETFERIARAQFVEMSVGDTSFELREKNVAALRDLNHRVKIPRH